MVLLLDDDEDFRLALAESLIDDGHAVSHFARPADVPPLGSLEQVTMLLLDQQLEGESGLAFADRFHAAHPGVPVVMMTVYESAHLASEVAKRDFLILRRKPIDYDELARLLPVA
jgi:two-component system, NtrC family, nitrogen regulation response regulator GlnG